MALDFVLPEQDTTNVGNDALPELKPTLMPEDVATNKAQRVDFALGASSPGVDSLKSDFINGYEQSTKQALMNLERVNDGRAKQQQIQSFVDNVRQQGRYIDSQDIAEINKINDPVELEHLLINPDTYFEKRYAKSMMDTALSEQYPNGISSEIRYNPLVHSVEKYLTKQAGFYSLNQEMETMAKDQSWLSFGSDLAETFVPFFSWWNTENAVKNAPTSSRLQGNNILEQIQYLNSIDNPDQAVSEARQAVMEMAKSNVLDAQKFARYLTSYSENEQNVDNVFSGLDVAGAVATLPVKGGVNMLRNIARFGGRPGTTIPGVLDASGQTARSAFAQVQSRLMRKFYTPESGASKDAAQDIMGHLHGFQNPSEVLTDVAQTPFSREYANRLEDWLTNITSGLTKASVLDPINITRIAPGSNAYNTMMREAENAFRIQYPEVNDAIIAVRPIRSAENAAANTDHIAMILGRKTGTLFDADYEAEAVAKLWGIQDYRVVQHGDKFGIEVTKAVDETLPSVRQALSVDVANTTPNSLLNRFMKGIRTRDEVVSPEVAQDLKVATFGAEQLSHLSQSIMKQAFDSLPKWRSSSRQDFMSYVTRLRDMPSPSNPNLRGHFPETIGEFHTSWRTLIGRAPSEQEATAFFTYKRVNDAEWMQRNLNIYKGKTRLGFERWSLNADNLSVRDIEARLVDRTKFLNPDDDAGLMVFNRTGSQHDYYRRGYLSQADRVEINRLMDEEGYRMIQLSEFGERDLRATQGIQNLPQGKIHYMLVKDYKTRPLSLRQIPYRPGGHVEYADRFFVSQAHVVNIPYRGTTIHDYYGDRTIMSAMTPAKATEIANLVEGGRRLLGDATALRAYLRNNRAPWSYQDFTGMFDASRGGILDRENPILARPAGSNLLAEHKIDRDYINFRDPHNTPHNAFNEDVNLKYAMDRNEQIDSLINLGTTTNPIYGHAPSRMIDPIATIERSANQAAKGKYIDDLKIKNAERFIAEFGDLLKGSSEEIHRYPMKAFSEGILNNAVSNKERLAAAKNYQRSMKEFFNIKDPQIARAETALMRMVDFLSPRIGATRAEPLLDRWVDSWAAHTINDPVRFFRQTSFYLKLGLFNPKQLFMQAQGVMHTAALEGFERAAQGMGAGYLMRPLHMSNGGSHLNYAASKAMQYGYRNPEQFKESYLALQRSGFQNVGGEYGVMDDFLGDRVIRSGLQNFTQSSLMFFREGERFNRLTAWNASYLRWRADNPLGVFNDEAAKHVLNYADTLTMNMTRASNAQWNQGFLSIPTQFWSFHSRLMDQMLGTRLSGIQKARVVGVYSALYGVPTAALGTTAGLIVPSHEMGRKLAIEQGYNLDDTTMKLFLDGIPQTVAGMLTGGLGPNLTENYGPSGNSLFYDLWRGNADVVEALGGPSSKAVADVLSATYDLAKQGLLYNDPTVFGLVSTGLADDGVHYRIRDKELMMALEKATKPISTVGNLQRLFYAMNAGTYLTKNGDKLITDANGWQATFTGLLGTQPQEINDFYTKIDFKKDLEKFQQEPRAEAGKWLKMSMDPNLSFDDQIAYRKMAASYKILGQFTEAQWTSIIRDAMQGNETEIDQFDKRLQNQTTEQRDRYFKKILGDK